MKYRTLELYFCALCLLFFIFLWVMPFNYWVGIMGLKVMGLVFGLSLAGLYYEDYKLEKNKGNRKNKV